MELYRENNASIDISSEVAVMTYTYNGGVSRVVLARVELGTIAKPIIGGTNYTIIAKVAGVPVTPISTILVPSGQTRAIMQSRHLVIEDGDSLTVEVTGAGGDVDIATVAFLMDATPARIEELVGEGAVEVDHNYGGADNYQYVTPGGAGIDNAIINAYLKSDYNAGRRGPEFVKATSRTNVAGRWERPMMLDPAEYVLYFYLQNGYGPDTAPLTVV